MFGCEIGGTLGARGAALEIREHRDRMAIVEGAEGLWISGRSP
jgi:hypothetical protein